MYSKIHQIWQYTYEVPLKCSSSSFLERLEDTSEGTTSSIRKDGAYPRELCERWTSVACLRIHPLSVSYGSVTLTVLYQLSPVDSGLPLVSLLSTKEILKKLPVLPDCRMITSALCWLLSLCSSHCFPKFHKEPRVSLLGGVEEVGGECLLILFELPWPQFDELNSIFPNNY